MSAALNRAWKEVFRQASRLKQIHLRELFASDQERFKKFSFSLDDLTIDFSKEKIDRQALDTLLELARAADITGKRDLMFAGRQVNVTERRVALHMALRGGANPPMDCQVESTLNRFLSFAEDIRSGAYRAKAGAFTDIVCIGIGGSDLGSSMAVQALKPDCDGPNIHFISNVDATHLTSTLKNLDPARTLVIISSKNFNTMETMTNAIYARTWLSDNLSEAGRQLVAISANIEACKEFGIDVSRVFGLWDWVCGRYSLWSAIGLPIAIAIGESRFRQFLAGAADMDRHFLQAEPENNLPVLFALIGIWRRNAMGWPATALIPYDQSLARFPAYIQQLDMESSGKRVTVDGAQVETATGPIIFGEPGTSAQHSFFQLLHQGTDIVPVDFIIAAQTHDEIADHHRLLLANCLAQSQALAFGKAEEEVRSQMRASEIDAQEIDLLTPHRSFPGDRPSTTILYRHLDAYALGRLISLFEHKIFVQGAIWNINSFDQWGVELGKELSWQLLPAFQGQEIKDLDSSTEGLMERLKDLGNC